MVVEGVTYRKFMVSFVDQDGVRRRWVRRSPALEFLHGELGRELQDRGLEPRGRSVRVRECEG
jgi:hypothetical protein